MQSVVPVVTAALSPFCQFDQPAPLPTSRMRPEHALDLPKLLREFEANTINTLSIGGNPWRAVSVFSPYSTDLHVMLVEGSPNRFVSGPEGLSAREGQQMGRVWSKIVQFMEQRSSDGQICVGYNWSPRSWGELEERGGFQSIPTKWHPMLWNWPNFPEPGQNNTQDSVSWRSSSELSPEFRRLMIENNYARPLSLLIYSRIKATLREWAAESGIDIKDFSYDARGLSFKFSSGISSVMATPGLFTKLLTPVAKTLDKLFSDLTDSFTDLQSEKITGLLHKAAREGLGSADLAALRMVPKLREQTEIEARLAKAKLPKELTKILIDPIKQRLSDPQDPSKCWRRGFGYALVFSGPSCSGPSSSSSAAGCELRIMPGVYCGSAGVVEALGVVLQRPENQEISLDKVRERSRILWTLGDRLKESA